MNDLTERFSSRVEQYVRYRPDYPPAVVDRLTREWGLASGWPVADVDSGPGNLSRLFLERGCAVTGVEPNAEMRAAGERLLGDEPRFTSVAGTAEATTLPDESVDLVVAGQAFHWFEPEATRREFTRVLRPPRRVALIWNERRLNSTPFLVAYEHLLLTYGTDYTDMRHGSAVETTVLAPFFGLDGYARSTFDNQQIFDLPALRGRLLSSSYTPEPRQPGYDAMLAELAAIFAAHQSDGVVAFAYDTNVYYGVLS
jgi:SAM-dependent methyltransferase